MRDTPIKSTENLFRAIHGLSAGLFTIVLVSCTGRHAEPSIPAVPAAVPPVISPAPTAARPAPSIVPPVAAPNAPARTLEEYKREVARLIYRTNSQDLFDGVPPSMLKSVVVLEIAIDAEGQLKRIAVRRSNGYTKLSQLAMQSVRRATPLPRPNRNFMRGGLAEFNETWLFREDGRFQIRSLAPPQAME